MVAIAAALLDVGGAIGWPRQIAPPGRDVGAVWGGISVTWIATLAAASDGQSMILAPQFSQKSADGETG
jgi:hypothetical protein